jgi:hypothetical protein
MIRLTKYLSNTRYSESAKLDYIQKFALRQTGNVNNTNNEQLPDQQQQIETTSSDHGHAKEYGENPVEEATPAAVGIVASATTNSGQEESIAPPSSVLVDIVSKNNMSELLHRRRLEAGDADTMGDAKRIRTLPRDVASIGNTPDS